MTDPQQSLPRRDLLAIWKVIEKLVVSTDRIAGAHEFLQEDDDGETVIDDEVQREHDRALAEYLEELSPEFMEARNLLLEHLALDGDEAEHLTRNVIQYWRPDRPTIDYDGDEQEGARQTLRD
jgi:hypothetical protein